MAQGGATTLTSSGLARDAGASQDAFPRGTWERECTYEPY